MEIFVCDEAGKPIAGADVQVEWSNLDRNNLQFYTRKTNDNGLLHIIRDQSVVLGFLQAHKEGMAFERKVMTQSKQDFIEQHKLVLRPVVPLRLKFVDTETKSPLPGALIKYSTSPYGHTIKQKEIDIDGYIDLDWFAIGEKPWLSGQYSIEVDEENNGVNNASKKLNGGYTLKYFFDKELNIDSILAGNQEEVVVELKPDTGGYGRGGGAF